MAVNEGRVSKKKVLEIAKRYGREHELCDVLKEAVAELGIEWASEKRVFTITVDEEILDEYDTDPVEALRMSMNDRTYDRDGYGYVIKDENIQHKTVPAES